MNIFRLHFEKWLCSAPDKEAGYDGDLCGEATGLTAGCGKTDGKTLPAPGDCGAHDRAVTGTAYLCLKSLSKLLHEIVHGLSGSDAVCLGDKRLLLCRRGLGEPTLGIGILSQRVSQTQRQIGCHVLHLLRIVCPAAGTYLRRVWRCGNLY